MDLTSQRPPTTDGDQPRQASTVPDSDFTLSIDEALNRYAKAGHPRTPRSVQRYCAKGHLEARLIETPFGEKWLITPDSVAKHIAYIDEVTPSTGRDKSRPVAASNDSSNVDILTHPTSTTIGDNGRPDETSLDLSRHVATGADSERYVVRLESENEFLRGQIGVKDGQIKELTERARETNVLIGGLQRMLSPLLGSSERRDLPVKGEWQSENMPPPA